MKIFSMLPIDRTSEGSIWVTDVEKVVWGPDRCLGEADNAGALKANNVQEDPEKAFGDHPYGVYRITEQVRNPAPAKSYGPVFMRLNPVSGQAWEARQNGRSGLGIHGGDLGLFGRLRPTYGCLRLTNEAVESLGVLVALALGARGEVFYECLKQPTPPIDE